MPSCVCLLEQIACAWARPGGGAGVGGRACTAGALADCGWTWLLRSRMTKVFLVADDVSTYQQGVYFIVPPATRHGA